MHPKADGAIKLSLLIPAHSAQSDLPQLVNSLLRQKVTSGEVELVISSDDGFDYSSILPASDWIVYAEPGIDTGPACARNRALKAASGTHVVMMDADDSVSGLYLEILLSTLQRYPACAMRSVYIRDGREVRRFHQQELTIDSFCQFYGSILVSAPRDCFPAFQDVVVEDGVATLATLLRYGGKLPVVNAEYRINLHANSYCATKGHTFTSRYEKHLMETESIAMASGQPALKPLLDKMYSSRLDMSRLYDSHLSEGGVLDYHEFVLQEEARAIRAAN